MPINREELEAGQFDLTFPIGRILADRPEFGFNATEIRAMLIDVDGRDVTVAEVERALQILVQRDRVQMHEMDDQQWYTVVQRRLGFRTER